jgi:soluble cytochrome b562
MSDKLPSLDDFTESDLPSVEEFLKEEETVELPSVEEFVEEEEVKEEDTVTIEDANGDPFLEVTDIVKAPEWSELVRMVNDVRESIPDIPEIRYYEKELEELSNQVEQVKEDIPVVPEVKYYDEEVETINEQIENVKHHIANLPEVKYYDEQLQQLEGKLVSLKESLPEVKYYDNDIVSLDDKIEQVRDSIPKFPKWVNEVNEVPDFSWIGKTFSVIDDDFVKVGDNIKSIRDRIDQEVSEIAENFDLKDFENKVEFEKAQNNLKETKDKIYEELKETAIKIWDLNKGYKDDDRKLKKNILSQYNKLNQNIQKQITETQNKNYESNKVFENYLGGLKEEIENLPKVKYYDDHINSLREDLKTESKSLSELYKIVEEIKSTQQILKEDIEIVNDRPLMPDPSEKQGDDPLTPTDQQFATLKDLASNYRLFVNRVEQQLYSIGGGGAGFIKDLDDVTFTGITTGSLLIYEADTQKWVGIASTALKSAAEELAAGCTGVDLTLSGDLNVTGDLVYDEQTSRNVNITGVSTFNQGIGTNLNITGVSTFNQTIGTNLTVSGVTTFNQGIGTNLTVSGVSTIGFLTATDAWVGQGLTAANMHVGSATTWGENLVVTGNARVTGILTIGTGSITLDPTAKKIKGVDEIIIGTATTVAIKQDSRGEVIFQDKDGGQASVGIGTTVSINTSGIVTASQFIVGAGGTDLLSELGSKTSIGLAIALG